MDRVIGPELDPYCFAYLDDIVVLGETFEQHLEVLQEVFRRLQAANLRLNLDKCQFGRRSLTYLGHVVTAAGIRTDPNKVAAIRQLATPKTLRQLRRFLGMASSYRRFIPDFSRIAAPLNRLLKKGGRWDWTPEQDAAFNTLKDSLSAASVLACPDFGKPFVLQTDAADTGLGVALTQYVDGGDHVITYASRSLTKPEQAYSTTEKECLAMVWGIEKIPYLENYRFTVLTDHQSFKWLQAIKNPAGRLARWAIFLQQHDFDIRYRKGVLNRVADTLSQQPAATEDETTPEDLFALEDAPGCNWYHRMRQEVEKDPTAHPNRPCGHSSALRGGHHPSRMPSDGDLGQWDPIHRRNISHPPPGTWDRTPADTAIHAPGEPRGKDEQNPEDHGGPVLRGRSEEVGHPSSGADVRPQHLTPRVDKVHASAAELWPRTRGTQCSPPSNTRKCRRRSARRHRRRSTRRSVRRHRRRSARRHHRR
jgi:hypothetical protein